ncbi:hypothetical protein H2198_008519 [Neophaeococcomyces mojaviensis]|uniref:Uncharacterized protein n=1 Tax=Neophaeococcomyces mojaviensis TaxID=3383035 RepID=A0ACC2ZX44_9EURO|nr:hypothetical protein H2198_008519 [Knufia sp. JES_112]
MPATPQPEKDDAHQQLLDQMDIYYVKKAFRSPNWRPSQRRNKNIKQIVSEAQRREASVLATQNNSGASTPQPAASDGSATPQPNMAQAAQSLSTLVLERNLQKAANASHSPNVASGPGPAVTYTNIESAPSLYAAKKHYCDITGLPARYTDPKTKLRYHNQEIFGVVRTLPPGGPDQYLAARGANVVLK